MFTKRSLIAISLTTLILSSSSAIAETFELLTAKKNFVSTGADNSLVPDKTLFRLRKNGTYFTINEETNIHSHYKINKSGRFKNYTYSGMMRIMDEGGGIGVTFYSSYPKADSYYRLRSFSGSSFHLASHPDSEHILTGSTDSGITPQALVWQRFKIVVRTSNDRTTIKAKVWPLGTAQPSTWQVDAVDSESNRIKRGKPGVWAMASGEKQWKNLKVVTK